METTNRPDSPLPWIVNLRHEVFTAKDFHGIANCRKDGDAAYIVHASNAYPKLMQALRDLVVSAETRAVFNGDGVNAVREAAKFIKAVDAAKAMLAECEEA